MESLLLKTPCTLDTKPGRAEVVLSQKPPPWELAYIVPEDAMEAPKGGVVLVNRNQ